MNTVLVIEDEMVLREEIMDQLRFAGYEVLAAADGLEGVELAKHLRPDIIVCDISMPMMNGYEVLHELRSTPVTALIPLIFLTAFGDKTAMRQGMELGADDYISKPFNQIELLNALQTRLSRQQQQAQIYEADLSRAKNSLLNVLSHELRTPLNSVEAASDFMSDQLETLSPDEAKKLLEIVQKGGRRLHRLADQAMLQFQLQTSLLNENTLTRFGEVMSVVTMLEKALTYATNFAHQNRHVQVQILPNPNPLSIYVLNEVMRQVLAELILNALNFSPSDGMVRIEYEAISPSKVEIIIQDQGRGIPADQLKKVTDSFQQIDREKHEQQGMGLGLSLAQQVIELHQGTLKIVSAEKIGTQAIITLPLAK